MPFKPALIRFVAPILMTTLLGICFPAAAATPEQVEKAIAAGKNYLYKQQKNGTWESFDDTGQPGGVTAICTYAMLAGGDSETDPRLVPAIHYLLHSDTRGTYALSFEALVFSKLKLTPEVKTAISRTFTFLLKGGQRPGDEGFYRYHWDDPPMEYDHSCSQYGALGVWACGDAGVEIPDKYWVDVEKAWVRDQYPDGGWGYRPDNVSYNQSGMAMSAGGTATLFLAQDALAASAIGNTCKGNIPYPPLDKAIKWISEHMTNRQNTYTWYGQCRAGMASGYKYFGNTDWYQAGANALIREQLADGSWGNSSFDNGVVPGTAYGVLFLARGRASIIMNKLRYEADPDDPAHKDGNWNERPRDVSGVATWMGGQLETYLNWQIVSLNVNVDDLHDAPILYISGNLPLKFSDDELKKLKKFVEDGGMIVGNADCASATFSESFRHLNESLADGKYEFRNLPADHPLFTREQFLLSKWKNKPVLMGLSNGVRELAILIPSADPAKSWQAQASHSKPESFQLAADLVLYAVDKQHLNTKGKTWLVTEDASVTASNTIKVARLEYASNWDPEPGGWKRLAAILHNTQKTDLAVTTVKLGKDDLAGYAMAHLTGTIAFKFDDSQRAALKKFVEGGGLLVIDAAGGSSDFAEAVKKELAAIFGADAAAQLESPLPASDEIYTTGEAPIATFGYRDIAKKILGMNNAPRVRGITINGRLGVLFSREDITGGLVGEQVDGIIGYTPETATALMQRFVLSTQQKPAAIPATTKAAP